MAARFDREQQVIVPVGPDEVRQALGRILESKHFSHAPKKQKFLRLLCDFYVQGKAAELNEYLIGREVFDRDERYNPADDPIVRVGAHDVRKKLELYYQNEGAHDEIRLEIPIGSYEPVFNRRRDDSTASALAGALAIPSSQSLTGTQHPSKSHLEMDGASIAAGEALALPETLVQKPQTGAERGSPTRSSENVLDVSVVEAIKHSHFGLVGLAVLAGLLLVVSSLLFWENLNLRGQVKERVTVRNEAGAIWTPFLKTDKSTLLVLSNPAVYRLGNAGDSEAAVKHSVPLTQGQVAALTEALKDNFAVRNITPDPRLLISVDTYTGIGEAIGAQRVTDLLRTAGKGVVLKRSRTASVEDLKDYSVILFGSVWANEWSGKLPQTEDFVYTGSATIKNLNVRPGEEKEYWSKFDDRTGRLLEDYALITVKPSITEDNSLMVLAGLRSAGTEAAAEFATNKNYLSELNRRLNQAGAPRYYQILLKVGVENGIPTTISIVTLHELRSK